MEISEPPALLRGRPERFLWRNLLAWLGPASDRLDTEAALASCGFCWLGATMKVFQCVCLEQHPLLRSPPRSSSESFLDFKVQTSNLLVLSKNGTSRVRPDEILVFFTGKP